MPSPAARLCVLAPSVAATHALAGALAEVCRVGDVVVLAGEMGTGKTAFAQGFGHALGVSEPITSPTFTLVHSYVTALPRGGRVTLHHADVYRLEQFAEVAELAFGELAEFDGIVLVEWGDVIAGALGDHVEVRLALVDDPREEPAADDGEPATTRTITVSASGSAWATRWSALVSAVERLGLVAC